MIDFIVIAILVVIVGGAVAYIRKAKKSGVKCIGCPEGANCGHKNAEGGCGCGCSGEGRCNCGGDCGGHSRS